MSDTAAQRVRTDSRVVSVEPDRIVRMAPKPGGGGGTPTQPAELPPTGVDRIDGEPVAGAPARVVDVDVAVIDTGIDLDHPDLTVYRAKNCIGRGTGDDGNGHGTHVAGTIGAKDNEIGVVGVAPGVRLWAVRVLDNRGSGTTSSVLCGVDYVTQNEDAIEVANMSLSGGGSDPDNVVGSCSTGNGYHDAICRSVEAGVTYVAAAGNEAVDAKSSVPAAFDEVITVSAPRTSTGLPGGGGVASCRADVDDTFADFSNFGADVDLIAPGVCIRSTWLNGGYNTISGTSMAAPHVAGAAALYKAASQGATPAQVQAALRSAGTSDWSNVDDKDGTKEPLLHVAGF
jgi:subtilisin family serine protease